VPGLRFWTAKTLFFLHLKRALINLFFNGNLDFLVKSEDVNFSQKSLKKEIIGLILGEAKK